MIYVRRLEGPEIRYQVVSRDRQENVAVVMCFPEEAEVEAGVCAKRLNIILDQEMRIVPEAVVG